MPCQSVAERPRLSWLRVIVEPPPMCLQPVGDSDQSVGGYSLSYSRALLTPLRSTGG